MGSEKTCTETSLCLVDLQCSQELQNECKKKSLQRLQLPCLSRSLLLQRESTLSGLEDPFLLLSQPSRICGSLRMNMMNLAPALSTENAHKFNKTRNKGSSLLCSDLWLSLDALLVEAALATWLLRLCILTDVENLISICLELLESKKNT